MSDTPVAQEAFSYKVAVADVPPSGLYVTLEPGEAERAALARHVGALGLPRVVARLHLAPEARDGVHVTGRIEATVSQSCVVSLEPFDAPFQEQVDVHFAPAGTTPRNEDATDEEHDPPDEVVGGVIDVGALMGEFLALGIDPYPRKPGAVFEGSKEADEAASPFAALARLKERR